MVKTVRKPSVLRLTFARNVRERRESIGLSQEALADICNLDRTYISLVERARRNLSLDNVSRIAEGLDIDPVELLRSDIRRT